VRPIFENGQWKGLKNEDLKIGKQKEYKNVRELF